MSKAISLCLRRARSSFTSPSTIRACSQTIPTRERGITWMFAALNTVEPPILELVTAKILEGDRPWAKERLPLVKDRIPIDSSSCLPA